MWWSCRWNRREQKEGSKVTFKLNCINNCNSIWSTQPRVSDTIGLGNIFLVTEAEMAGIPVQNTLRFAKILNLKFFDESNYYITMSLHLSGNRQIVGKTPKATGK